MGTIVPSEVLERVQEYFWDFAEDRLPPAVFDTLYSFSGHLITVYNATNSAITHLYKSANGTQGVPTLTSLEQILPPLLSIVAIWFGFLSIYRTTTSLIRTALGIVKWVSIISLLAMGAGYFLAQGPFDTGMLLRVATELTNGQQRVNTRTGPADGTDASAGTGRQSYGGRTRTQRGERQDRRPGVLDSFLNHQEWKDNQQQAKDTQEYVQQVVDGAQKVYKDGSGFFDLLFGRGSSSDRDRKSDRDASGDPDYNDDDTQGKRQTRSQTRRTRRDRD